MSAHAGVIHFDGRTPDPATVAFMGRLLEEFGPDGGGEYIDAGVLMLYRALHVTPEDRLERQPYRSSAGLVITWDGRLDNRLDLLSQLDDRVRDDRTDVSLATAAYEKWAEQGLARLVGDWSLVVWDPFKRAITLASDYAGNRGLYYFVDSERVVWSSSLGVLIEVIGDRSVSTEFVAGYLTGAIPPGITPYAGVYCLPPAHAVTVSECGRSSCRQFWELAAGQQQYADRREYASQLRSLVIEAVEARLRALHPVWAELSGGLDSSTIVCVANRLLQQGRVQARSLQTISFCTDESPDERVFIHAVEQECARPSHYFKIEETFGQLDQQRLWITPDHPAHMALAEYGVVRSNGGRVVLSGHPGDFVFGNTTDDSLGLLEPLAAWRMATALRLARQWSASSEKTIWEIGWNLVAHLGPMRLLSAHHLRQFVGHQADLRGRSLDAAAAQRFFLRPDLLELWKAEVSRRTERARALGPAAKFRLLADVRNVLEDRSLQSPSELPGVATTYPFAHRPLVVFVLSLPAGVITVPGRPRALMKEALDCVLPGAVAKRFSKGRVAERSRVRAIRAFARSYTDRVGDLHLVKRGYVDASVLRSDLATIQVHGVRCFKNFLEMIKLERWLCALEHRSQQRAGATVRVDRPPFEPLARGERRRARGAVAAGAWYTP